MILENADEVRHAKSVLQNKPCLFSLAICGSYIPEKFGHLNTKADKVGLKSMAAQKTLFFLAINLLFPLVQF